MSKNVSVPLVCALASMAGNKHPIPIAIVNRPRIAFNIFYSLEGRRFARKKDPDADCEGSAEARSALCAEIGEAKGGKVKGSCTDILRETSKSHTSGLRPNSSAIALGALPDAHYGLPLIRSIGECQPEKEIVLLAAREKPLPTERQL
jgi:hypothetical protein